MRAERAALLLVVCVAAACQPAPEAPPPHGIVLIGLDTLRADRLSAYGHDRPTSPNLDRLAERGFLFENAISPSSWTLPGFAVLMTGHPFTSRTYRARRRGGGKLLGSLVESFREAGYATAAFTEGGYVSRVFGFDAGFDEFQEDQGVVKAPGAETGAARTFERARSWLAEHGDEPFFLFIHTFEIHTPYRRRHFADTLPAGRLEGQEYDHVNNVAVVSGKLPVGETEIAYVRALYDGGILEADRAIGALLGELDALGLANRTVVAVTSDHGEALSERDPQELGRHGHALYDAVLRVPLILHDPRRPGGGRRIPAQVRTLDVMPTLLDLAGIPLPGPVEGRSLVPLLDGTEEEERLAYGELLFRGDDSGSPVERASLRAEGFKLVLNDPRSDAPLVELYDLARDPHETTNLADERRDLRSRLYFQLLEERAKLDGQGRPRLPDAGAAVEDEKVRERLRALGYIE